jgi:two-component sensor histidine kinase
MKKIKLLDIGISSGMNRDLARTIRTVNLFSWLTVLGLVIGSSNALFLKESYPLVQEIIFLIIAVAAIILNYVQRHSAAEFAAMLNINGAVFFVNEFYDESTSPYLFYFPLLICIALLYSPHKSKNNIIIHYMVSAAFFAISFLFDFNFIQNPEISTENNSVLFAYNIIFCIGITGLLVYLLMRIINNQYHELLTLFDKEQQIRKEKEILLAEVHHRVKNNMAVITGLINLQLDKTLSTEAIKALNENKNRILSISKVHEKLYKNPDLGKIEFSSYTKDLINDILSGYKPIYDVKLNLQLGTCEMPVSKAIPVGLILNEAFTNILKHAFDKQNNAVVTITLTKKNNAVSLRIADNGKGFDTNASESEKTLGLSLMNSLAGQIDGTINFTNNNGACIEVVFSI